MRLTPPLLLIAKYTHIHVILEMLITTDLISVDQTLNSFNTLLHQGPKLWNSPPYNLMQLTSFSSFKTSLKKIPHQERYKLNSPDHDMTADTIS